MTTPPRSRLRARVLTVTAAGLGAALLLGTAQASATTQFVSGHVTRTYTYGTVPHTVAVAGSNIYLTVTDTPGVAMKAYWFKCEDRTVRGQAVEVGDGNRHRLGTGFKAGARICLAYVGDIAETGVSLPWSGRLELDLFS